MISRQARSTYELDFHDAHIARVAAVMLYPFSKSGIFELELDGNIVTIEGPTDALLAMQMLLQEATERFEVKANHAVEMAASA